MAHYRSDYGTVPGTLYVEVGRSPTGDLTISGQHLWSGGEYEYAITVRLAELPALVAACGGEPGGDPWALVTQQLDALVGQGEQTWLQEHGIESTLWTHADYD
ncbi:MAG: hypothetical protein ABI903_18200 [Actinomycetota bacterium]